MTCRWCKHEINFQPVQVHGGVWHMECLLQARREGKHVV